MTKDRVGSGTPGMDDMLGGGYLEGDANLLAGSPGTGKTTLGLQFIAEGAQKGQPGLFISFEYLPQQIYRDAAMRGIPLREWESQGLVTLLCTTPEVLLAEVPDGGTVLDQAIRDAGAKRVVLDSMTHFRFLDKTPSEMRLLVAGLMTRLRLHDATVLLTHEVPGIVGPHVTISDFGLEFLVDTVVLLRYVELDGKLDKAICVLKHRGSDHDRSYRQLTLSIAGAKVEAQFEGVENISSGAPHRSIAARARELI